MTPGLATTEAGCGEPATYDWSGLEIWRDILAAHLASHCRDANEVDDLVQETFLRAARSQRALRSPERFRTWLLRIAFNALRDLRRRSRSKGMVPIEEALDVAEPTHEPDVPEWRIGAWKVSQDEALGVMRTVQAGMCAEDQRLLLTHYGDSTAASGVPKRLVKVRLFRARRRLRTAMRHHVQEAHTRAGLVSC